MGWRRSAAALLLAVFGALVLVNRACRHATARVQFDSGHALEASAEREAADNTVCHTELLQDVDIFGHDVGSHRADAAEECCVLCQGLPRCGAFSFVGGTCWFKGEVDMELDRQAYPGCISGKIRDKPETSTAAAHALPAATATQVLVPVAEESLRPGITLVLHGDTSRLPMMMQACHRWAGAVALSVLVYRGEELVAAERLLDRVAAERGRDRPLRWCAYRPPSIAPSARVSAGNEKATADVDGRGVADWVYPVNIMRNRALQLVETRQLMLIDGDFIPSDSMQQIARTGVEGLAAGSVLLVPPFQSRANVTSAGVADPQVVAALLRSKASLIKAVEAYSEAAAGDHHHNEAAAAVAQPAIAPYGPFLAWQVDYARWWEAADDYAVQSIFESEPYYVISTSAQLPFDERYVGFGGDKQEQWLRLGCGLTRIEVSATHYIVHFGSGKHHREWGVSAENGVGSEAILKWRKGNLRMWKELKDKHTSSRSDPMSMCEPARIVPFRQWSTAATNEGASSSGSSSGSGSGSGSSSGGMIYPQVVVDHADIFAWAIGERPP